MAEQHPPVMVVIPARYGSLRFPGKALAMLSGKPLIQHVYERVRASRGVSRVLVATDDIRIQDAVEAFGGSTMLTGEDLRTGTDRVAAVARQCSGEVFVNLQGDELLLHPELITDLVEPFLSSGARMGTLKRPLTDLESLYNANVVKVVTNHEGEARYFS
ncbi:MAG: cytidylyltransferase domain-containing protein, partial [Nitrospiraceae bacterium]